MPNVLTMYSRDLAIRSLFCPGEPVELTSIEVALTHTVAPNNADLTQIVEITATLYARQPYGLGSSYWAPTGFGGLYNTQLVQWAEVLDEGWGLIAGWVLIDTVASAVLNTGSILRPYDAITGNTPKLPPGTMVVGFTDTG